MKKIPLSNAKPLPPTPHGKQKKYQKCIQKPIKKPPCIPKLHLKHRRSMTSPGTILRCNLPDTKCPLGDRQMGNEFMSGNHSGISAPSLSKMIYSMNKKPIINKGIMIMIQFLSFYP